MSIFNERKMQAAIAAALKEKLRKGGLSNLAFKLYLKSGEKFDIIFEGASAGDIARASELLGSEAQIINKSSASTIDSETLGEVDRVATQQVSTRPKSK
jgi:hypothetical protein